MVRERKRDRMIEREEEKDRERRREKEMKSAKGREVVRMITWGYEASGKQSSAHSEINLLIPA